MFTFTSFVTLLDYIDKNIDNDKYLSHLEAGQWQHISSKEFVKNVKLLSAAFYAKGITKGSTVAIISDSSPFWLMIDFALQRLGAISVPIFANVSSENLHYEIGDSEINYAFIASQEKYDQLESVLAKMKLVVTLEVNSSLDNVVPYANFISSGGELPDKQVDEDDIATIIYTSGSTGTPKGVELTHKNFISQIKDIEITVPIKSSDIALSFLPLAHIFERMVMSYYLANGVSIYFADDVKNVGNLIKEIQPTLITVVPRLLDKIYTKMHDKVYATKGIKGLIGKGALYLANTKDVHKPLSFLDKLAHKLVYGKLMEALGGRVELMICGGAPLSPTVERFFVNIGVPLFQGYGLSETSPVICVNSPRAYRFGSCGKKLPRVDVKLLEDGELLVKGPNVMRGYHKQPQKTAETMDGEWLKTGDLASIDKDGYIFIQSRKKELFKTSTGKYVPAINIEQRIGHSKWVDYAVIVADNRPFVTALIFLDPLVSEKAFKDYIIDPQTQARMKRLIEKINPHLAKWERIQKYTLIDVIPTIENHILTPSMKVSRYKAYEIFSDEIEAMYTSHKED